MLLSGVVAAVSALRPRELEELLLPGVEVPLAGERRWMAGLRGMARVSGEFSAGSCGSWSESSRPLGYSAQDFWTWERVIGVRFSSLAERVSKQ